VLAATDPANAYGAALPWPERPGDGGGVGDGGGAGGGARVGAGIGATGHRPGRKAGALVVLVDGRLVLYVERGGRTLLTWSDDPARLQPAVDALALAVRDGSLGRLAVERADGGQVLAGGPLTEALEAAGFRPTPRGLRLRA
jgi:ATP-dependent Lhr-like helicase